MKKAFYFKLKAFFVLDIFTFMSKVNFKIYDATAWTTKILQIYMYIYIYCLISQEVNTTRQWIWSVNRM